MDARIFADYLREIDRGAFHQEVSEKMNALVEAVANTGKAGSITLRLDLKPRGGNADVVELHSRCSVKAPEAARSAQFYFVTPGFNLSRRDPRQMDIEESLQPIEGGAAKQEEA